MHDKLFDDVKEGRLSSFAFDRRVVEVFDDMVSRSVPGYSAIQMLVADLTIRFAKDDWILDVGCSTGNTIAALAKRAHHPLKIVGIDQSIEMIEECRKKVSQLSSAHSIEIIHRDLMDGLALDNTKRPRVIILNLVLMFIRPIERLKVLKHLWQLLSPDGCLILVEKTIEPSMTFNQTYIEYYHQYKREMGYSEMEIAQKREALENRLIPFTRDENIQLLRESGFAEVSTFFQWINFCGFIATRQGPSI